MTIISADANDDIKNKMTINIDGNVDIENIKEIVDGGTVGSCTIIFLDGTMKFVRLSKTFVENLINNFIADTKANEFKPENTISSTKVLNDVFYCKFMAVGEKTLYMTLDDNQNIELPKGLIKKSVLDKVSKLHGVNVEIIVRVLE